MKNKHKNKGGRPPMPQSEKDLIVSKLEPYLKIGLSLYKAILNTDVNRATVERLRERDPVFRDKIESYKTFPSVMMSNIYAKELQRITEKQAKGDKLTYVEASFLDSAAKQWKPIRDEFGSHQELTGPKGKPLIPEAVPKAELEKMAQFLEKNVYAKRPKSHTKSEPSSPDAGNGGSVGSQ